MRWVRYMNSIHQSFYIPEPAKYLAQRRVLRNTQELTYPVLLDHLSILLRNMSA